MPSRSTFSFKCNVLRLICRKARPASRHPDVEELMAEPTEFYSGASGYAGATMRDVIQQLESYLPLQ